MRGLLGSGSLALTCALTLCACQSPAKPSPTPSAASSTALSADDAAKAARALFEKYLATSDTAMTDGQADVSSLKSLVTASEYEDELKGVEYLRSKRLRLMGTSRLVAFKLQTYDSQTGDIGAYTCVDYSNSRVIDRSGKDVTPKTRQDRQTTVSHFLQQGTSLLLDRIDAWPGPSIC